MADYNISCHHRRNGERAQGVPQAPPIRSNMGPIRSKIGEIRTKIGPFGGGGVVWYRVIIVSALSLSLLEIKKEKERRER